jgi:hypothetical protein
VLDRDDLPEAGGHRRGVPHARHAHALRARGSQILEELFPGVLAELVAGGTPPLEDLSEVHFQVGGHRLHPGGHRLATVIHLSSRGYLERHVRRRVRALPGVEILPRCEVTGLVGSGGCWSSSRRTRRWPPSPPSAIPNRSTTWSPTGSRRACAGGTSGSPGSPAGSSSSATRSAASTRSTARA